MAAIEESLAAALDIPGAQAATLVDFAVGLPLAAAGGDRFTDAAEDAEGLSELLRTALASPVLSCAATGDDLEELTVSGTAGHHLLMVLTTPLDARLCLHLRLDRERGNLALARHRLREIARALAVG
ncbi:hypothetical protein [Actinocorallia populi]|uniref:hypothetical protein n=1 Tax=Actinocorallia populi TaxID=2079200 RepID=UPI000D08FAE9|nr:hypothetical protein [Actinocorallia populi]